VATWLIDNAGDLSHLEGQIAAIWPELEAKAKEPPKEPAQAD